MAKRETKEGLRLSYKIKDQVDLGYAIQCRMDDLNVSRREVQAEAGVSRRAMESLYDHSPKVTARVADLLSVADELDLVVLVLPKEVYSKLV